ncbi:MAG: hypothetical protein R3242_03105 [Akkermansiaceae bacterium]|nr:hypothetical protein [Akkermansiaceae bacterium]
MKPNILLLPLAALALAACKSEQGNSAPSDDATSAAPAAASTASGDGLAVNVADPSPHFNEVMKHLDVGGKSLKYRDHEGQREFWVGMMELVFDFAEMSGEDMGLPQNLDIGKLVDESGMCNTVASGRSMNRDGDHWLMRYYGYSPKEQSYIAKMMGKPQAFRLGSRLSAATDIALEMQVDGTMIPGQMRRSAEMMGEPESADETLGQELPIGMTLENLLMASKAKVLIGIELGETDMADMPVIPEAWIIEASFNPILVTACKPMITDMLGEAIDIAGRKGWQLPVPPAPGLGQPVAVIDGSTLIIASTEQYLASLDGELERLASDPVYQAASNHFPEAGNLQCYLSPEVAQAARKWMDLVEKMEPEAKALGKLVDKLAPDKPWSLCLIAHPTGLEGIAEMPFAVEGGTAAVTTVALGSTSVLFVGARAWKKGADRSACILNQRNIQQAIRGHQNMFQHKKGEPINWNEIFGPEGYMNEPVCPQGGRYNYLRNYPPIGTLACGGCSIEEHQLPEEDIQDW